MATYYCDPDANGNDDGSDWTNAWETFQQAADNVTAGDICYCRNTDTLTAPVDFDTNSGVNGTGYCKFIGCAADGSVDGTRFVLDANSAAAQCILSSTVGLIWLENIEMKNATGSGYDATGQSDNWVWVNCISHNNSNHGWDTTGCYAHDFIKCQGYSNTDSGFYLASQARYFLFLCVAYDNSDNGFYIYANQSTASHCITHDNGADSGDRGFGMNYHSQVLNCIADGEVEGIYLHNEPVRIYASRITNCTEGIDFNNNVGLCGWNLFHNNTNDRANPAAWSSVGLDAAYIQDESETNTNLDDQDADDGYENLANDDFNLKPGRTYNGDGSDTVGLNIGS